MTEFKINDMVMCGVSLLDEEPVYALIESVDESNSNCRMFLLKYENKNFTNTNTFMYRKLNVLKVHLKNNEVLDKFPEILI